MSDPTPAAEQAPFSCGPRCDHEDAPHLYLNSIDPDRCAACAAWPSLPCAQHRETVERATPTIAGEDEARYLGTREGDWQTGQRAVEDARRNRGLPPESRAT